MLEFMQTIGKGIIQGGKQYIDNDLSSYVPFFYHIISDTNSFFVIETHSEI